MDLQYCGGSCVVLGNREVRLVVDDTLASLGLKSITKVDDIALFTGPFQPAPQARLIIDGPGEYEVSNLSILGVATRAYSGQPSTLGNTIYKVITDDTSYLLSGHTHTDLSDEQLESIGLVDVMLVPIGNNGYTLDATAVLQLIKKIEPKVVIPIHYDDPALSYPVPQQSLEQVAKGLGMEPRETTAKFRFKTGETGSTTQLVVLKRS